jgi:hypothetical protein
VQSARDDRAKPPTYLILWLYHHTTLHDMVCFLVPAHSLQSFCFPVAYHRGLGELQRPDRNRCRWHNFSPEEPLGVFVRELDASIGISERSGPGCQFSKIGGLSLVSQVAPDLEGALCSLTNHSPSIAADALRFNNAAVISSNDDLACSHAGFPIDSPTEREYKAPASR